MEALSLEQELIASQLNGTTLRECPGTQPSRSLGRQCRFDDERSSFRKTLSAFGKLSPEELASLANSTVKGLDSQDEGKLPPLPVKRVYPQTFKDTLEYAR